jgi:trimethylamine--corrinoid protein Co-methyltransferase
MTTIEVLTAEQRAQVHERTLHVLEHTGMRVDSDEGRRILKEAGALVDESTRIVRLPCALVERSLATAPRDFALGGRRPGWRLPMNAGESSLCLDGGTLVLDRQTGERRRSTHDDWLEATRLCDALEEIGMYWSPVEGGQTGDTVGDWVDYVADKFRNFSRHVNDSFEDAALAPWTLEVLEIVFGGRREIRRLHPYSFLICPVSPLVLESWQVDAWLALRGYDIPVAVMPMPIMGATAPGSLLATTLLGNCETLGTLCLVEAAEPGVPFIHAPTLATMDPREGDRDGLRLSRLARHPGRPRHAGRGHRLQLRADPHRRRDLAAVPQDARGRLRGRGSLAQRCARARRPRRAVPRRSVDAAQRARR